ncbi:hypothetical protein [Gellertiella hungarica]|uniref:Putative membrane protein n=1 Tax=Gellertiella hungarica TaxID=1572859 RepID=A0A7W6J672_9HYPH|nr:hypothetical protein [Gellertiella hungarica]MBB4065535.1 putative membrane protein [Gellertiella hungarica]
MNFYDLYAVSPDWIKLAVMLEFPAFVLAILWIAAWYRVKMAMVGARPAQPQPTEAGDAG